MRLSVHQEFCPAVAARRGFTLTELAIVLGVIGVILAAIWSAASMAIQHQKVRRAEQQILTIVSNLRALYANNPVFLTQTATNISPSLTTAGVFPSDMLAPATVTSCGSWSSPFENAWQGAVVIWEANATVNSFRVSYYGVPADACAQIASDLVSSYSATGPINLITAASASGNVPIPSTGLDPQTITTYCKMNTGASCPSVEFDYNLQ